MSRAIRNSDEIEILENITLVSMKTANSFHDIMRMEYGVFLGTVKQIRMTQLMENPEWREAYFKWQAKESYKNGKIQKQTKLDLEGLMSLQSGL